MTDSGLALIEAAKRTGRWEQSRRPPVPQEVPEEFKRALKKNNRANAFFAELAPSYQRQFTGWIGAAKRQETTDRRVKEAIALLEQGKKLGLK